MSIVSSSTAHASHETKHHHHDSHDQDIFLLAIFRVRPWAQAFNPHDPLVREVHHGKMGVSTQMTLQKPQNMMHSVRNTGLFWGIPQFWKTHTHTHPYLQKIARVILKKTHVPSLQLVVRFLCTTSSRTLA